MNYTSLYKYANLFGKATESLKTVQNISNTLQEGGNYEGPDLWGMVPQGSRQYIYENPTQFSALFPENMRSVLNTPGATGGMSKLVSSMEDRFKPHINNALYKSVQSFVDEPYDGYDYHGLIPEGLQDNAQDLIIKYGDNRLANYIKKDLMERGVSEQAADKLFTEENTNTIMRNFLESDYGKKAYPKLFNRAMSEGVTKLKDWVVDHKGILAGAVSLPLILMFAKRLMGGRKQRSVHQPQTQAIHPMRTLY